MGVCGSVPALPTPDKIDITHFQEYKVIGRGGFGTVHAVVKLDPATGKEIKGTFYAMKRFSKEKIVVHQANLDMLWRERDIMIAASEILGSKFLCQLYWAFQTETEVFLVMEFLQGGDLRYQMRTRGNINKQRPLAEDVARYYAAETLLALLDLHKVGIVYRDLKPENAMLDNNGHLRLADFGISEKLSAATGYTTTGRSGTLGYMSPEMLRREPYGREVDVWAFGVMLYELLHADLPWAPYQGPSQPQAVTTHFARPVTFGDHVSAEARDLLVRLLDPDPARRVRDWPTVMAHSFFAPLDWTRAALMLVPPPITPEQGVANCTANAQLEVIFMDDAPKPIPADLQEVFADFEYIRPECRAAMGIRAPQDPTVAVEQQPDLPVEVAHSESNAPPRGSLHSHRSLPSSSGSRQLSHQPSDPAHASVPASAHSSGSTRAPGQVRFAAESACVPSPRSAASGAGASTGSTLGKTSSTDMGDTVAGPDVDDEYYRRRASQVRPSQKLALRPRKARTHASTDMSIGDDDAEADEYLRAQGFHPDAGAGDGSEDDADDAYEAAAALVGDAEAVRGSIHPRPSQFSRRPSGMSSATAWRASHSSMSHRDADDAIAHRELLQQQQQQQGPVDLVAPPSAFKEECPRPLCGVPEQSLLGVPLATAFTDHYQQQHAAPPLPPQAADGADDASGRYSYADDMLRQLEARSHVSFLGSDASRHTMMTHMHPRPHAQPAPLPASPAAMLHPFNQADPVTIPVAAPAPAPAQQRSPRQPPPLFLPADGGAPTATPPAHTSPAAAISPSPRSPSRSPRLQGSAPGPTAVTGLRPSPLQSLSPRHSPDERALGIAPRRRSTRQSFCAPQLIDGEAVERYLRENNRTPDSQSQVGTKAGETGESPRGSVNRPSARAAAAEDVVLESVE